MTNQDNTAMELPIIAGFLYGIQSDFLSDEEVRHRVAGFRTTKGYKEAMQLIQQHTQKAKKDWDGLMRTATGFVIEDLL